MTPTVVETEEIVTDSAHVPLARKIITLGGRPAGDAAHQHHPGGEPGAA